MQFALTLFIWVTLLISVVISYNAPPYALLITALNLGFWSYQLIDELYRLMDELYRKE